MAKSIYVFEIQRFSESVDCQIDGLRLGVRVGMRFIGVRVANMMEMVVNQFRIFVLRHFSVGNADALVQHNHPDQCGRQQKYPQVFEHIVAALQRQREQLLLNLVFDFLFVVFGKPHLPDIVVEQVVVIQELVHNIFDADKDVISSAVIA